MSDQKFNILFVEEIKKRPLLYNPSLPQYQRRDLTEAAWDEVGKATNLTGPACKEKWKNLRTVYSRHLRRFSDEPSEKRKKYYLRDHMSFILPYMRIVLSQHSLNSPESEEASTTQHDINSVHFSESIEDSSERTGDRIFPIVNIKREPSEADDIEEGDLNEPDPVLGPVCDKEVHLESNDHSRKTANEEKTESHRSVDPRVLEVRRMFLLGLADEVAMMTDAQMRSFKRKVLQLIDEILET